MFFNKHKEVIKVLWFFMRDYKHHVFVVVLTMMISGGFEALNLAALYPVINYGLGQQAKSRPLELLDRFFDFLGTENQFRFSCILLVGITIVATTIKLFCYYLTNKFVRSVSENAQKTIFEKFYSAQYGYFAKNKQGYLIYANTIAPQGVSNSILFVSRILNNAIISTSFIFFLFLMSWKATFVLLTCGVLYFLFIRRIMFRLINQCAKMVVEADRDKNVILNEFISGVKSIRIFQMLDYWRDRYFLVVKKSVLNNFKVLMGKSIPEPSIKCTLFLLTAFSGIFFSFRDPEDVISVIPLLGTFMVFVSRLFPSFNQLGNDVLAVARNFPDTQIAYDILNEDIPKQRDGRIILDDFQREIVFHQVSFKHEGMHEHLLKNVSFQVPARKVTAIVGPSGAGKTTITNLLLKLYEAPQGRIFVDGININEIENASYLSKIGFVGQETFIFNGSIRQNIQFGRIQFDFGDIQRAAQLANAEEFILEKPEGYEALVGDAGIKLSGGQKQRLALARAILGNPKILILDEATSSLDNISERMIQEALSRICRYTTVLVIAHRLSTVQNADKIIVLEKGEIVEEGTHQNLLDRRQKYFELYAASSRE